MAAAESAVSAVASASKVKQRYEGTEDRPLGSFLGLISAYGTLIGLATAVLRRQGRSLPDHMPIRDLVIGALATHKASRLLAKDPVSSPFRAPFTKFEGQSGEAEIAEDVVGRGPQHAVGELVTCPFCLDVWVATGFVLGYVAKPRLARIVASTLTIVTGADMLQFGYDALQRSS